MATQLAKSRVHVSDGWYARFLQRHPELTDRQSQSISRARNACTTGELSRLFYMMLKVVAENDMDGTRVYNIDETSFLTRKKSTTVVALRGSRNVWSHGIAASFHLTVVACGSASGHIVPPLFVLPRQRAHRRLLDECTVEGARVTCTQSGFINRAVFIQWVEMFAASVPCDVRRPLLLLFDGYLSHISIELLDVGAKLGILFVCLPANATHIVHPMDIAVFAPFKSKIRALVQQYMFESVRGADSVKCMVSGGPRKERRRWIPHSGALPVVVPVHAETARAIQVGGGGLKRSAAKADWLQHRDAIVNEVLTLPSQPRRGEKKRKTVDVAGKLLTRDDLHFMSAERTTRAVHGSSDSVHRGEMQGLLLDDLAGCDT